MKSPRAEWVLGIGYLAAVDVIRAKGEADGDTLSEVLRDLIARTPCGRPLFVAALVAGGVAFHHHIDHPLRRPA